MDIGYGYDSEDSFVDDSEAVCECTVQPKYFKGENFHGFHGFMSNLENLTLKILSCITILYYVFAIREIFITKLLKAMNPRKF